MKFKNLKEFKIYGVYNFNNEYKGIKVEITKIDWKNKSINGYINVLGGKTFISYKSGDAFGETLKLENFIDIEIVPTK